MLGGKNQVENEASEAFRLVLLLADEHEFIFPM